MQKAKQFGKINQWLAFIDDYDREMIKVAEEKNDKLKKARIEMNYLTGEAETRRLAELREKWEMDEIAVKKNAERIGRKEGNVEGRDAFSGKIDAIISDGFTGNVFLKTTEGLGKFVKKSLKESMMKNILSKIASIPSLPAINRFAKTMDYKAYGGALFLGVKKPVVKAHGSSDEILFEYTIIQAEKFVENKAVDKMIEQFTKNNEDSNKNVND
mgnify:CR=1 FL=1